MANIEIKARCSDLSRARAIADKIKTDYVGVLHQIDTYFFTKTGRLKLREINNEKAQLIPYIKDYQTGPMKSDYALLKVEDPLLVKDLLNKLLGIEFIVDKRREVFLIDNVRVHLDEVKNLGSFIEFEAVCESDDKEETTRQTKKVNDLVKTFEIVESDLLEKSYVDYLKEKI
jgi:predicted adenylyl cyclase CyaB